MIEHPPPIRSSPPVGVVDPPMRRRRLLAGVFLAVIVLVMSSASLPACGGLASSSHSPGDPISSVFPSTVSGTSAASPSRGSATGSDSLAIVHGSAVNSTGPGTFFDTTLLPNPSPVCLSAYQCFNNTDEPSLNLTTKGVLAIAYTAYTNASPCAGMVASTTTLVGFSTSSTLGSTWAKPEYVGNPKCTGPDGNFADAAQPSLTSLSNGTLVLAYEEFNYSATGEAAPEFDCYVLSFDRIVVSESYNNGTTWTTPNVLDSVWNNGNGTTCTSGGYPDLQPWVTAFGQTIYVAWTNVTSPYFCAFSSEAEFRASTNGGSSWTSARELPTIGGSWPGCVPSTFQAAANPSMLVAPDGTLYIAYMTGFGLVSGNGCTNCQEGGQIELATSTTNGSSFSTSVVSPNVVSYSGNFCCAPSPFEGAMPSLAYDAANDQLFVAWASESFGDYCQVYSSSSYCYTGTSVTLVTMANSSDGGRTFSVHPIVGPLANPNGGTENEVWNPSIGVTENGVLHLQANFENDSVCASGVYGAACGAEGQIYMNSTDNGSTWSAPVTVYYNDAGCGYPFYEECSWVGQYSTVVTVQNTVLLAWTYQGCDLSLYGFCEYSYEPGPTAVAVSRLYTGAGLTLTFQETGVPAGSNWTADVMGNYRVGSAGSTLSVTGVPVSQPVSYQVPWVNQSWGIAYRDTVSPASPSSFSTSSKITATYTEQVRLSINTAPALQSYYWTGSGYANYAISPAPSVSWITPRTSESETISSAPTTFCYPCMNLTFLAWDGVGGGSITTSSPNITFLPTGPVNETAMFDLNGYCTETSAATTVCLNNTYYPMNFVETGLPLGTTWGATVTFANGTVVTNQTSGKADGFLVPASPVNFTLWTVPDPTTGEIWVPTTNVTSPTEPITSNLIPVRYQEEPAASNRFTDRFSETGLPTGTAWSVSIGNESFGVTAGNLTLSLPGGGPYAVNGSYVYTEGGVGYYASGLTVGAYVENATTQTIAAPAHVTVNGSAEFTVVYQPMYLLTTAAGNGGVVTPATQWFPASALVPLDATALPNFHFVSWTGSGSGSTTTAQDATPDPVINLKGPVTELATFRGNVAPTWNLSVVPVGLPVGATFTVGLGSASFTQSGSFLIGNLSTGDYPVAVPTTYLNTSQTTRFALSGIGSDLSFASPGVLNISSNGTLTVTFQTEYLLQLSQTPAVGGSVTPAVGVYWEPLGSAVDLTASPASGYRFISWNLSSSVGSASTSENTSVTMTAPVIETAQFALQLPSPPFAYALNFTESGLPSGVDWNVTLGSLGASGTATHLVIGGLFGTYTVSIPTVYDGAGTRFVAATLATNPTTVVSNESISVSFTPQYLVTVTAGPGGTVTPSSTWVDAGASVTLSGLPNASSNFVGWTGAGTGSYTGAQSDPTFSVNAPVQESAAFAPVYHAAPAGSTGNSGLGIGIAIGALVALLVVGLVVGMFLRRRSPAPAGEDEPPFEES